MLSLRIKMEPNSSNSIECYRYHIHNYSALAVKSFIGEVQKYPIIFSLNRGIPLRKELVEFAWSRITVALLDTVVPADQKIALVNLEYWNQSFHQLWRWMFDIYLKEQAEIRRKSPKSGDFMKYQWLKLMCFLDPYIRNCDYSDNTADYLDPDYSSSSGMRLVVLPAETKVIHLDPGNHIILWLRKFSESVGAGNMCISVCMEIQKCSSPPLPQGLENMFRQDADIDESQLVRLHDYTSANVGEIQAVSVRSSAFRRKRTHSFRNAEQVVPFETVIDKDYRYIMSLYPKLVRLGPDRKTKVKRLMILALFDAL